MTCYNVASQQTQEKHSLYIYYALISETQSKPSRGKVISHKSSVCLSCIATVSVYRMNIFVSGSALCIIEHSLDLVYSTVQYSTASSGGVNQVACANSLYAHSFLFCGLPYHFQTKQTHLLFCTPLPSLA